MSCGLMEYAFWRAWEAAHRCRRDPPAAKGGGAGGSAEDGSAKDALAEAAGASVPADAASEVPADAAGRKSQTIAAHSRFSSPRCGFGQSCSRPSLLTRRCSRTSACLQFRTQVLPFLVTEPFVTRLPTLGCLSTRQALIVARKVGREMVAPFQVGVLSEEDNSSVEGAIAGAFEDSGERVLGLRNTRRSITAVQLCRSPSSPSRTRATPV